MKYCSYCSSAEPWVLLLRKIHHNIIFNAFKLFHNHLNWSIQHIHHCWKAKWCCHMTWTTKAAGTEDAYSMYTHKTLHIRVCSWKTEAKSKLWIKYVSRLAVCPQSSLKAQSHDAFLGPFGQRSAGVSAGWGDGVYSERVWGRVYNQPESLLSNHPSLK